MKITIIGTGYVGLVTGACLADVGNDVVCLDVDSEKIAKLRLGEIPIFEPGLDIIVKRNIKAGRLRFTTNDEEAAKFGLIQIIAVGTPPGEDGSADLQYVEAAARSVASHMNGYRVIVDKSTVPVGTADRVESVVTSVLASRGVNHSFVVASNPEFLKEGAAIEDFTKPDRIVFGVEDSKAEALLRELYAPFQRNHDKTIVMSRRSAELTKYAANAMLATRISFMNEIALIAERLGASIEDVRRGIGSDPRIGFSFLYAGTGYGGSCFPKDVKALIKSASEINAPTPILNAVELVNGKQKLILVDKARGHFGSLKGLHFAVWGLAFKPGTDDVREAPSLEIVRALLAEGASVCAYDPVATFNAATALGQSDGLTFSDSAADALNHADALMVVTEWKEFRAPDFDQIKSALNKPLFISRWVVPSTAPRANCVLSLHASRALSWRPLQANYE
jgi:UDPglucose 6-dehydrogenase